MLTGAGFDTLAELASPAAQTERRYSTERIRKRGRYKILKSLTVNIPESFARNTEPLCNYLPSIDMKYFNLFYSILYFDIKTNQKGNEFGVFVLSITAVTLNLFFVVFIIFAMFEPIFDHLFEKSIGYLIFIGIFAMNTIYIYSGNRRQVILEMADTLPANVQKYRGYIVFLTPMILAAVFISLSILRAQ